MRRRGAATVLGSLEYAIMIIILIFVLMSSLFAARNSVEIVEEGNQLAPKFDAHGLIPVVTTDSETGELLMHAYMNEEALLKTIETGDQSQRAAESESDGELAATILTPSQVNAIENELERLPGPSSSTTGSGNQLPRFDSESDLIAWLKS